MILALLPDTSYACQGDPTNCVAHRCMSWTRCTHIDAGSWKWSYPSCMVCLSTNALDHYSRCTRSLDWRCIFYDAQEGCTDIHTKYSTSNLVLILSYNFLFRKKWDFL